jgi:hypothetical protein
MTKSTPPLEKHATHNVEIRLYTGGKHSAYYRCLDCNKFISWLSREETNQALALGLVAVEPRKTRNDFFNEL